jgi:hypothetical protein
MELTTARAKADQNPRVIQSSEPKLGHVLTAGSTSLRMSHTWAARAKSKMKTRSPIEINQVAGRDPIDASGKINRR